MNSVFGHNTQPSIFCINATVNIRNSISDFLDSKYWVQIPEHKNMSWVFRTWKIWVQFSGFIFWGRDLEIIHGKNQKKFKVPKMSKIIPYCPNVSWGNVFGKVFFDHCSMDSSKVFEKFKKNSKLQKCPRSFPKMSKVVLNMFCGNFLEKKCPVFHGGSSLRKVSEKSKKVQFSKIALNRFQKCANVFWTCFGANLLKKFLPSVPCSAFQVFWT